jgi:hypothetical protein
MDDLAEARRRLAIIRAQLPSSINVANLGVRAKSPYLVLCAREALIWRTEELARCACDTLERNDLAAGSLLTRGVTESAAFVWRLKQLLEERNTHRPDDLHDRFSRMLLGWKNTPDSLPAFNIITMIEHLDRQIPGVKAGYDQLSEFAHPNWSGVFGLFSETNWQTYTTKFARGARGTNAKEIASILLAGSLDLFERGYNSISETLPEFVRELRASEAGF